MHRLKVLKLCKILELAYALLQGGRASGYEYSIEHVKMDAKRSQL